MAAMPGPDLTITGADGCLRGTEVLRLTSGSPFTKEGPAEATRLLGRRPRRNRRVWLGPEIGLLGALREPDVVGPLARLDVDVDVDELRQTLLRTMR
jgi:hypothetical protein